jgi:3-methyl-2-oxobutanoate hydroxymethyltransferase
MVLVGDSLGNVMLGHDSTIPVTIADMVHHTAAVRRVVSRPFLAADMPFLTYATKDDALRNAGKFIKKVELRLSNSRVALPSVIKLRHLSQMAFPLSDTSA